jgi:hypothetical protein
MTYRLPRTLPYLSALLGAAFVLALFFAPGRAPISPLVYLLVIALALAILVCGIFSQLYAVTVSTDRLVISFIHQNEYLFANMIKLEILPGRGVWIAVITMNDGTRVNVNGSIRDFRGFLNSLSESASLSLPASNLRWSGS